MPARKIAIRHQDDVRRKIQATQLINRLTDCAMGKIELSGVQVAAIKILLDKSISNAPTELSGPNGGAIELDLIRVEFVHASI